ncbi:GntR family transcriptional regulator [Paraburkholderia acidicola]|uniref:GntR family transcriptional regulator n=1 Tax=Paraburkholderia acidicola TaxID=1912599 RepID=A0A2A4EQ22_9BURK|nr:FCD domain-containing protein [Paraburkholderia acidicola]PCE22256.1 GntR family transcriptional regulator [Paraburkholderia acidicola]
MSEKDLGMRAAGAKALAAYLLQEMSSGRLSEGMKLPPERKLSETFGASRGTVRRVLQDFKARGLIAQAVGSGTFVQAGVQAMVEAAAIDDPAPAVETSPAELMEARLLIEPLMPLLIASHATASDFSRMDECLVRAESAETIEEFEHWDAELHKSFAAATHNSFFLQILDLINDVRERGEWGRLKQQSMTPERRKDYEAQHRALVASLRDRDAAAASAAMQVHLRQIQQNLFGV